MWDKIKGYLAVVGAALAPLLGLLAYIFMLKRENTHLKDSIAVQTAKDELGKVLDEKEAATKVAGDAESAYDGLRDAFLRAGPDVQGSNPSSGPSAGNKE